MKFKQSEAYKKLADRWEIIRIHCERSPLILKIDDIITGYDAKTLLIRSFILAALIHFMLIFSHGNEEVKTPEPETRMIQIQFGTEAPVAQNPVPPAPEAQPQPEPPQKEQKKQVAQKEIKKTKTAAALEPVKQEAAQPETHKAEAKPAKPVKTGGSAHGRQAVGEIAPEDYLELLQYTVQEMSYATSDVADFHGVAILRLAFNRQGYVQSYSLKRSSGNQVLDEAAINVARTLMTEPFPAAPKEFDKNEKLMQYDFFIKYKPKE